MILLKSTRSWRCACMQTSNSKVSDLLVRHQCFNLLDSLRTVLAQYIAAIFCHQQIIFDSDPANCSRVPLSKFHVDLWNISSFLLQPSCVEINARFHRYHHSRFQKLHGTKWTVVFQGLFHTHHTLVMNVHSNVVRNVMWTKEFRQSEQPIYALHRAAKKPKFNNNLGHLSAILRF